MKKWIAVTASALAAAALTGCTTLEVLGALAVANLVGATAIGQVVDGLWAWLTGLAGLGVTPGG